MNEYGANSNNLLKQSSYEQRRSAGKGDYFMTPKRDFESPGDRQGSHRETSPMQFRSVNDQRSHNNQKPNQEDKFVYNTPPTAGVTAQRQSSSTKFGTPGLSALEWESRDLGAQGQADFAAK